MRGWGAMHMVGSSLTMEWLVVGPEDGFGAGESLYVEKRVARAEGEVCPKSKVFGLVVGGKGAKSVQKGPENSKLLARISGYLRVFALISGFGIKIGPKQFESPRLREDATVRKPSTRAQKTEFQKLIRPRLPAFARVCPGVGGLGVMTKR